MKPLESIEQITTAIECIGESTHDLAEAMALVFTSMSKPLASFPIDRTMERAINARIFDDRVLYLREITKYSGYKITLEDLENK